MSDSTADILAFCLDLADEADAITMRHYRSGVAVREKSDRTLVTDADEATERMLRERIMARFPTHSILGEEEGFVEGEEGEARWILDPIDGTHSYARDIPIWATLIAFERGGELEVGVASAPALGTRWWAARGLGAYRGALPAQGHAGERIHVSDRASIEQAQILEGGHPSVIDAYPGADALLRAAWRTRSFSDFWGHCLVAEGSAEAMVEGVINAWDIAALQVIVEEAGGRMTDLDGARTIDAGHVITTNGAIHEDVLRRLKG
ncbi:MAG: inositol monophosphatase family protein [Dehalococcoidia bacterium]